MRQTGRQYPQGTNYNNNNTQPPANGTGQNNQPNVQSSPFGAAQNNSNQVSDPFALNKNASNNANATSNSNYQDQPALQANDGYANQTKKAAAVPINQNFGQDYSNPSQTAPMNANQGAATGNLQAAPQQQTTPAVSSAPFEGDDLSGYSTDRSLLRTTTERIPNTYMMQKDCGIPLGVIVKPFGELPSGEAIPQTNFGNNPIVRCKACRAYMNPFVRFYDQGQKWECNFCHDRNPTDNYYYSPLDASGYRQDIQEKPELNSGTVDFVASMEYSNRPPMPPTYVFVFDVSKQAIDSGYLYLAATTIKSIIEEGSLPGGERTRVSFICCDKSLYYFNLKSTLKQPQMMVISDLSDGFFLPQPDDFVVDLQESYDLVMNLLDNLPNYFVSSNYMECCYNQALNAAAEITKALGGKILFFQLAQSVAQSQLLQPKKDFDKNDRKDLYQSSGPYFANQASELAHMQISVDYFIFTTGRNQFKNLQTFADLPRKSSGNLFYYQEFNSHLHGMKFTNELYHNLTRSSAWEAVFRIRVSYGFKQLATYGNILIKAKTADLILCPQIDKDRAIVYDIERMEEPQDQHQKELMQNQTQCYIQTALLYSTSDGQRLIRVHNSAIPLTNKRELPFEWLDTNALTHYWMRRAIHHINHNNNLVLTQQFLEMQLGLITKGYGRCVKGQQTLPENLQYLIMYVLGLLKQPWLSPNKIDGPCDYIDWVNFVKFYANCIGVDESIAFFHPQIYEISTEELNENEFPPMQTLTRATLRSEAIYLIYNGFEVYVWVGSQADPHYLQQLLQVNQFRDLNLTMTEEQIFADTSKSVWLTTLYSIINSIRYQGLPFAKLQILAEGHQQSERIVRSMMMLDPNYFVYGKDYQKFLNSYQQAAFSGVGHGRATTGAPSQGGQSAAAYY